MFVETIDKEKVLGEITQKLEKIVTAMLRGNTPEINETMAIRLLAVSDEIANFGERFGMENVEFIQLESIVKTLSEKLLNRGTFILNRKRATK